jgi:hypothetical protein
MIGPGNGGFCLFSKFSEAASPLPSPRLCDFIAHGYFPAMSFLEQNLAAMKLHTPATAALIEAARIPDGFVPATGTDGSATFLRSTADHLEWLGETSMPCASAAALVAGLNPGSSSGLGLSIGTGHEWLALLARLAQQHALYVYESDASLLRMALTVCDLAPHLASARIVLLAGPGDAAANALSQFLASHLGHEPPAVLHPLATLTGDRRNTLLSAGEAIVRHAIQTRQNTLNQLAAEIKMLDGQGTASLALLATARYPMERPLHGTLDPATPLLHVDRHASASIALRARELVTHRPRKILSDFFRADLGCIPPVIPVETWVPPLVGPAFWQPGSRVPNPSTLPAHDRIIVHAHVHKHLLESLGIPPQQIELRPLQCPATAIASPSTGNPRVALVADLGRTDAAALGVQLPTHQAVHAAASALIAEDYLTVNFNSAADILRRALARASVPAAAAESDPGLQDVMLRIIRDVLIPTLPLLTLARTLLQQEIPLRLIGDWSGFEPSGGSAAAAVEPFNTFAGLADRWKNTAAVVHLSPWGVVSPIILEAAAAQVPVIALRHPTDGFFGALPQLLGPALVHRPQPQQLVATIKTVVRKQRT